MSFLKTLWAFSRPHTIIGSLLSITALYVISLAIVFPGQAVGHLSSHLAIFFITLLSALCCNVFITGLNQVVDVPLDKINKPWLPIASGALLRQRAISIVVVAGGSALILAAVGGLWLFVLIAVIMLIGALYSLPPVQLKRHHIPAALCILLVRGVLVNVGMPIHFIYTFSGNLRIPPDVWPVTAFVTLFSIGIAWFKDIPDTQGDAEHKINTLALQTSPQTALALGRIAVVLAFVLLIVLTYFLQLSANLYFVAISQGVLLALFLGSSYRVVLHNAASVKAFYMTFWGFFFAAYILIPISYLI